MGYSHEYRVWIGRRGRDGRFGPVRQEPEMVSAVPRDENGELDFDAEKVEVENTMRVRGNTRDGALRSARQRIPDTRKVVMVRRVD